MYGSKAARDKLKKTGGSAKKKTGGSAAASRVLANLNNKTGIRKSAYSKLKNASTKALATKKLRSSAGTAKSNMPSKSKGQGAGGKYTTKAYQEYLKKMKAGQRKSVNQRKKR